MKNILEKSLDNRLEILKGEFPECFDREGKLNIQKFQEIVEPSNKVFKDSYGLNWLGKTYARKLAQLPISTVLSEDKEHNEKEENKNSENVYIKGDNLEVLRHLISAYSEKVKMIYIDPPYNTGNGDFVYNDSRSFTEKELDKLIETKAIEESEKDRILSWIDNKSSSHSAWLTFMLPRLYLARKLLREDGVIFISIDDNEASQLKLLCDEIFGEENFVSEIIWQHNLQPKGYLGKFSLHHNYNLMYSKTSAFVVGSLARTDEHNKAYSNPDNDPKGLWRAGDIRNALYRPNLIYNIITPSGKVINPPDNGWRWSKETLEEKIKTKEIVFRNDETKIIRKIYLSSVEGRTPESIWFGKEVGTTREAVATLKELFGKLSPFDTPKPINLVKYMSSISNINSHDLILDFFSGSATTAHAVMQLNAEDGGNRKYIMVQLEEEIEEGKEAFKFCKENNLPTNITSIGIERIKRAAKKIKEETKAEIDYGFKIYSVKDVPNTITESIEKFNSETIKLFESKLLTEEEKLAILTTYKVYDGNMLNKNIEVINLGNSSGYKVGSILYLIDEIKSSSVIKNIIEKLDSDRDFSINKIVIYGYTQLEGKYRIELKENIKTYANKKSATIDVEVRY